MNAENKFLSPTSFCFLKFENLSDKNINLK